jgi:hypothetical protein
MVAIQQIQYQLVLLGVVLSLSLECVHSFTPIVPISKLNNNFIQNGKGLSSSFMVHESKVATDGQKTLIQSDAEVEGSTATTASVTKTTTTSPIIDPLPGTAVAINIDEELVPSESFSYGQFAKTYPFWNNVIIATFKTGAADFIAQTVIAQTPITELDVQRTFLFMMFGCIYSGGFQWFYQVNIFKKLFDVDKFTNLSWRDKLDDTDGLKALAAQTALDLTVLAFVYLPSFYIFKAAVFSGSPDPGVWASIGFGDYAANFNKDEADALKVWFPADLVCFSVPLYLRLPVRHGVSFLWTAYLSFSRGGH